MAESAALADQKRALRRAMSEERSRLAPAWRAEAAAVVATRLAVLPEVRAAAGRGACVAGFAATRGELDPAQALDEARRNGAAIALPRVSADEVAPPRLRFHRVESGGLRPGRFGILEPDPACPEVDTGEVAVMVVPGLAFDAAGNRLGFGGGYYDEILAGGLARRPAFVVGVGYDFQVVDQCPADQRDGRVDCVVTEARVIRCSAGAPDSAGAGAAVALAAAPPHEKVDP